MNWRWGIAAVVITVMMSITQVFALSVQIIQIDGEVLVKTNSAAQWEKAVVDMKLEKQAQIQTKAKATCVVAFDEARQNIVTLYEKSQMAVENIKPGNLFLPEGRVFTLIRQMDKTERFEIRTPTAIAGARGTGWLTEFQDGRTVVACFEDIVSVEGLDTRGNPTGSREVANGLELEIRAEGKLGNRIASPENRQAEWQKFMSGVQNIAPALPRNRAPGEGQVPAQGQAVPPAAAGQQAPAPKDNKQESPESPLKARDPNAPQGSNERLNNAPPAPDIGKPEIQSERNIDTPIGAPSQESMPDGMLNNAQDQNLMTRAAEPGLQESLQERALSNTDLDSNLGGVEQNRTLLDREASPVHNGIARERDVSLQDVKQEPRRKKRLPPPPQSQTNNKTGGIGN
jgi:hypothetical protein